MSSNGLSESMNMFKGNDLLESKAHLRLADIAHTLLKVAPYDRDTMSCKGLQRFVQ